MNLARHCHRLFVSTITLVILRAVLSDMESMAQGTNPPSAQATVLEAEGTVQTAAARTADWRAARTNESLAPLDRLRTRERSRAALRLRDRSVFRLGELSEVIVEAPDDSQSSTAVNMLRGVLMFFHRGNPRDVQFRTGTVSAAIRGTEFHVEVADNGRTVLTLFDGEVELSNPQGTLRLVSGEQAAVDPGQPPVKTAVIVTRNNLIQWCLYYPGVLDPAELNLTLAEETALQPSLAAYRAGDLLQALALVPAGYQPVSDSTRVYLAAVLLSVGKVDAATTLLDAIPPDAAENSDKPPASRLAGALRRLVLVVKNSPDLAKLKPAPREPHCATLRLAESYEHQAKADLAAALTSAREATTISPNFAFAWARVAELEFSFGRRREAQAALARSLELAPRNAQAVALRGFLLAAEDRIPAAFDAFNQAIALDGALGNAWLGRGLCRIRRGELNAGREDLQVAALMEPQRALLRSYLGKAWNELGDQRRAAAELRHAKANDPRDPTAYLYEALLLQEENRINEAVTALERSQELNDNRRVYRSRLLLDQDAAVRGANLATIYRDAGMTDWSAREAGRALTFDYANGAAHQFLSESYEAARDPRSVNLRYETPAVAEHLLASLLSPVGSVSLSRQVSQQEYSRLFERDRIGLTVDSSYLSRGTWSLGMSQHGTIDGTAYALDASYLRDPGERRNGDFEQRGMVGRFHRQITSRDTLYLEASASEARGGDVTPYYRQRDSNPALRTRDIVAPTAAAGWHRDWSPESHTLFLGTYLHSDYRVHDPSGNIGSVAMQTSGGEITRVIPIFFTQNYRGKLDVLSGELQHILQTAAHTTIGGLLYQNGTFRTRNIQDNPDNFDFLFLDLPILQAESARFERLKPYFYHHWEVHPSLTLAGGLAYDWMRFPANHRSAPISDDEQEEEHWSPKLGAIWSPRTGTVLRAAQSWSAAGTSFDQSYQLEPTQVAGFNQAYRSLIPEAVAGANAGARFGITSASLEQRFDKVTFVTLSAERLASQVDRRIGMFTVTDDPYDLFRSGSTPQELDFVEESLALNMTRLVGSEWAFNGGWRVSRAELEQAFRAVPASASVDPPLQAKGAVEGVLHRASLRAIYSHASGFFGEAQGLWWHQSNHQDASALGDEDLWHANAFAGWRGWRRRAEITVGVLNLTDRDYRLSPINLIAEPLRDRTFFARLRLSF